MCTRVVISWALIGLLGVGIGMAEEEKAGGEDLAQQARDPTGSLTMLQIRVDHVNSFHNLEGADETRIVLQPIIPFKLGNQQHIARITLPYVVAGPDWGTLSEEAASDSVDGGSLPPNYVPTEDKTGLGDTGLFDFLIFNAPWKGRLALGISAIIPTATDPALGTGKWSLGPAAGALVQSDKILAGVIALSNFSFAGDSDRDNVQMLSIQILGSYGLSGGWSLELSEITYNYDFHTDRWTTVPFGLRVGKLAQIGKTPVRFYGDVEYNFADSAVASEWTYRFAVVPLL